LLEVSTAKETSDDDIAKSLRYQKATWEMGRWHLSNKVVH
jgi:hypothetical protein